MYDFQYLNEEGQWVSYGQSRHMDARCAGDEWAYLTFQIGITPGIWDCEHQRILGPDPEPAIWPPSNCGYGPRPTDRCHPSYVCTTPLNIPWWRKKGGEMLAWEAHFTAGAVINPAILTLTISA